MVRVLNQGKRSLYVWKNLQLGKSRMLIFFTLFVLALLLFIMNRFPYASVGLVLIPVSYVLGICAYKNYMLWSGGSRGEESVNNALAGLDDSYILLNSIVVPPNRGDTDHIILGVNGLFVVESKNYGGEISCNGDVWSRRKVGRGGGEYHLDVGSPSNQVKRNAKVLKDFILSHKSEVFSRHAPHIWVHSILVFTNKDAVLKLSNPTVDVVPVDGIVDHIKTAVHETRFFPQELDAMAGLLLEHST